MTDSVLIGLLSMTLRCNSAAVSSALESTSALCGSGLVRLDPTIQPFFRKLSPYHTLTNALSREHRSVDDLLSFVAKRAPNSGLSISDFAYLAEEIALIKRYVTDAKHAQRHSANILLYGEPGVGKTELARVIAHALGMRLYEVNMEDSDNQPLTSRDRFQAFYIAQQVFARDPEAMMLFDEIEDVFINGGIRQLVAPKVGENKAWTNKQLEAATVPTFWIANQVHGIDPAFLRRFDYILEMRAPPRSARLKMLQKHLNTLPVSQTWLEHQATRRQLTPALVERAARVIRAAGLNHNSEVERTFERIVNNTLKAQDQKIELPWRANRTNYSLGYINTSKDLTAITAALLTAPSGRLLLYGPPGTGKTAYAHYLAEKIDKPLLVRRASDLLSPWVGVTEQNLAKMFQEAVEDDAMLLLDEADSFLQDRTQARSSWEITQVNELLTQMEAFDGVFICATNFLDRLDAASLRRFQFKIGFEYLTATQRAALFESTLQELGATVDEMVQTRGLATQLKQLSNLTPGDFAAVRDQLRTLHRTPTAGALYQALNEESGMKRDGKPSTIGFVR